VGSNVNIMQGAQMVLSVVSDGCYIPFRAALYGTSMMENSMVAQNTILQGSVIGRNTFIGGGSVFTDYNLMGNPIRTMHRGMLQDVGMAACGGAVGHDCRIGAGFVVYPGRTIESGTVLPYEGDHAVIDRDIHYHDVPNHTSDRYARHVVLEEDPASGWLWLPHKPGEVLHGVSYTPPVTNIEELNLADDAAAEEADPGRELGEPISAGADYHHAPHFDLSSRAGEPISQPSERASDYAIPDANRSMSGQHYIVGSSYNGSSDEPIGMDADNQATMQPNGNGQRYANGSNGANPLPAPPAEGAVVGVAPPNSNEPQPIHEARSSK
jgi:acetyltransferase-like isoleucine patch superfamily enzyme